MATPKTMRAINLTEIPTKYTEAVPLASLVLNPSHPVPVPSSTEYLIQVHATNITPYELSWPTWGPVPLPRIPNHDVAGTVISSPSSPKFQPGTRVFGLLPFTNNGGMAEYVTAEEKWLAQIPDEVDFVSAASVPRNALTAWQAVRAVDGASVKKGETVLLTGATGAAGRMMVQVLKSTVGKEGKVIAVGGVGSEELAKLGADITVNYREEKDWESVVLRNGQVDAVFDCVGAQTLARSLPLVKDGGLALTIGSPPPEWEKVEGWPEAEKRGVKKLFFIVSGNGEQLGDIAKELGTGGIKPTVALVVEGLSEEGVRNGWARALKGGLAGSVTVQIL